MAVYTKTSIFDWIENGPNQQGIATLLDEAMPGIEQAALADSSNVVRAITLTIKPTHHGTDPVKVRDNVRRMIKQFVSNLKTTYYCTIHSEYTENCVIHFHGFMCGRISSLAKIISQLKKEFGFMRVKEPWSLIKWIAYCNKENNHPMIRLGTLAKGKLRK